MKLVKLVGIADSVVDDIVCHCPIVLHEGSEVVMLESDWIAVSDSLVRLNAMIRALKVIVISVTV